VRRDAPKKKQVGGEIKKLAPSDVAERPYASPVGRSPKISLCPQKFREGLTLVTNDFFMYYFMYTGIHVLHVAIGLGVLIFLMHKIDGKRPVFAVGGVCSARVM
jgi:hypothetical protein